MSEPSGMPWHGEPRPIAPSAGQQYRVIDKLESGGMAEVFRAESTGLEGFRKQVAIKRVLPHLGRNSKFISMFLDEARLSAQLSHSNCVQVFDIGVRDDAYFIVMEFVDGANLKSLQNPGRSFPIPAAVYIAHEICKGLSYAHELTDRTGEPLRLVHRDVSPANVLVTKHGEIKIVDFGLAKATSQLEPSEPGVIKGKFAYLAPEAALGEEVDCRADIYAVGIILWELLSGRRLFAADTDLQTLHKAQAAHVPPLGRSVPPELDAIVRRALSRDRSDRYASARELGEELARFLFRFAHPVSAYDIAAIVQATMRERENARLAKGSFIHQLIEDALLEFRSLQDEPAPAGAELPTELLVDTASPAGLPAIQEGNLAALEDDAPPRYRRVTLAIVALLLVVAAALALAACGSPDPSQTDDAGNNPGHDGGTNPDHDAGSGSGSDITSLTPGTSTIALTVAGNNRTALLYVPTSATSTSQLAIALHGNGDTDTNFLATSGLKGLADADGTVLIIPQGIPRNITVVAAGGQVIPADWDAYNSVDDGNIDLPLLDELRTQVVGTHQVDSHHVFVFGYSQGGYLAFEYGMVTGNSLSCSAVLAASSPFGGGAGDPLISGAQRKLPVVQQIGTNDSAFAQAQQTDTSLGTAGFVHSFHAVQGAGHVPIPGDVSVPWQFCESQSH